MSIERDKDFEQLEDIAAMMTENPGIEFENGKYVYYGLDSRTAFAAVYIGGAWAGWQAAKAQAVPDGFVLVPKEPTLLMQRAGCAEAIKPNLSIVSARDIYKAMIEVQEPK